jgi:purine-binding chemotaxis protein CheW
MPQAAAKVMELSVMRYFLTFRLGKSRYALAADGIAEVVRIPPIARLPQAPAGLLGVANLRGEVVPVADIARLLQKDRAPDQAASRAIVLRDEATVALAVDGVDELVEIAADKIETRQAALAALPGERLEGAFRPRPDAEFVKIVDVKALLAASFVPAKRAERRIRPEGLAPSRLVAGDNLNQVKFVAFQVGEQEYALPLAAVQEIARVPDAIAAMPHAEALVLGVGAFRDTLLPLLSLRGLLGFAAEPGGHAQGKIIVLAVKGGMLGLVADKMTAIFSADESRIDPVPEVLAARSGGESRIKAIYRGEDRLVSILSPELLFGEDVMQKLGAMRESVAQPAQQKASTEHSMQLLVFRLGDEEFGLPIEAVEEVARVPEQIARIPKTPKFLEGVVNLRGEVLPVVDQRKRFNLPEPDGETARRLIVVRTKEHKAGLIVDSVSEVLRSSQDAVQPAPDLAGEPAKLVHGVINLEDENRIILLLEPGELLTRAERGLLDAFAKSKPELGPG